MKWALLICCVCVITILTLQTATSQNLGSSSANDTKTGSLAINCTFNSTSDPSFIELITLAIVLQGDNQSVHEKLAVITPSDPDEIEVNALNASVSGHAEERGVSYLNLQWDSAIPANDTRLFLCEAKVLTHAYDVVSTLFPPNISLEQPNDTQSLGALKDQQKRITDLQKRLDALNATVDSKLNKQQAQIDNLTLGKDTLDNLTSAVDTLEKRLADIETNCSQILCQDLKNASRDSPANLTHIVTKAEDGMFAATTKTSAFIKSAEYNGKHYLLSNKSMVEDNLAEIACINEGGYLAEIDGDQEYQFIKNFINSSLSELFTTILVGAIESQNGWIYRYSKRTVVFDDWANNEPKPTSPGCMFLFAHPNADLIDMVNVNCYGTDKSKTFLCEVA